MKSRPTTRSLFSSQHDSDDESEHEQQSSTGFTEISSQLVRDALSEIKFRELSGREQQMHVELEPPAPILDSVFFHDGIQFSVTQKDFSPAQRDEFFDNSSSSSASSSSSSASSSSSSAPSSAFMRPPSNITGAQLPPVGEWRYTIPTSTSSAAADPNVATAAAAEPQATRRAAAVIGVVHEAIPAVAATGPVPGPVPPLEVPVPMFGATALGTDFVPEYLQLDLPSAVLAARFLARASIQDLTVGLVVLILGFTAGFVSVATVSAPIAAYLVVNKLPDGSTDAVLAYSASPAAVNNYPKLITFMPSVAVDQSTVVILNEAGVRSRCLPTLLDAAKLYQVALVGAPLGASLPPPVPATSMLYDTPESQLKREAREDKLIAVNVCLRGNITAVNSFVGPARDLSHDTVLARIYPKLSVAQRACPWARPDCLPLFLQFLFSPSYLVLKGQGINLTAQHLLPNPKSDIPVQIESVTQIEQCVQGMCSGYTTIYCQPGSPLHNEDPLFFYNIAVPMLEQLRSTAHQSEYLAAIPINCVVQAFNECLAALGLFMRTPSNAALPFAVFQAGAIATLDLKPKETVMGAHASIHCQELFVIPQFSRFDGKATTAPVALITSLPPQSRKRSLPQSGPPSFRQRTSMNGSVPRANPVRPAPPVARLPHLGGNNPAPRAGPQPAGGAPQYICVSDFVSKIDSVRYPLGCTTPNCPRRHVPLPALGQFAAADKAELLQSLSRMKGTRVAPMIALIQGRN